MTLRVDSMVYVVEKDSEFWNGKKFVTNSMKAKHYGTRGLALHGIRAATKSNPDKRKNLNLKIVKIDSKPYKASIERFNNFWDNLQTKLK